MANSTYSEKLLNPNWQKKRLDILNRDGFACLDCGSGLKEGKTLHVHHKKYVFGVDPWNYPDENFETLCVSCHAARHKPAPVEVIEVESKPENPMLVAAFEILYADLKPEIKRLFSDVNDLQKQVRFLFDYENVQVEYYLIWSSINNPDTAEQYKKEQAIAERFGKGFPDYETYAFKEYFELRSWLIRRVVESLMYENMSILKDNKDLNVEATCMIFHSKVVALKNRFVQYCKQQRA